MIMNKLNQARMNIEAAIETLEENPEIDAISEILDACSRIDAYYREWCKELDDYDCAPKGTNYKDGVNMEFYIEGLWWHDVSRALRKLINPNKNTTGGIAKTSGD